MLNRTSAAKTKFPISNRDLENTKGRRIHSAMQNQNFSHFPFNFKGIWRWTPFGGTTALLSMLPPLKACCTLRTALSSRGITPFGQRATLSRGRPTPVYNRRVTYFWRRQEGCEKMAVGEPDPPTKPIKSTKNGPKTKRTERMNPHEARCPLERARRRHAKQACVMMNLMEQDVV